MLKNVQNKSNLFSVFIIAAITLFISQSVLGSGSIVGWGDNGDGQPGQPDFVTGDAAAVLKGMIEVLLTTLGCE